MCENTSEMKQKQFLYFVAYFETLNEQQDPNNDPKCLFFELVSKNATKHPGGSTLLESGAYVGDNAATALYLSYHITKDFDEIEKMAKGLGSTGVSNIKRTALYRDLDDVFRSVQCKYAVHAVIYKIYCVFVTALFVMAIVIHCMSSTINPSNSVVIALSWISYSFAVFHTRVQSVFPNVMHKVVTVQ